MDMEHSTFIQLEKCQIIQISLNFGRIENVGSPIMESSRTQSSMEMEFLIFKMILASTGNF